MSDSSLPDLPRWWMDLRDDARRPIDDDGFLVDAETAAWLHRGLRCFQLGELVDVPCLVLLGEAGAGKTHALERIPVGRGTHVLPVVALRDISPRSDTRGKRELTDIFDSDIATAWRRGSGELVVRLDGLDECSLTPDGVLGLLKETLEVNDLTRLQLRVTSRPASWRTEGKEVLRQLFGRGDDGRGDEVRVLELLPLRREDVARAIVERGITDPLIRVEEILRLGLGPLASQPDTLRFLLDEMAEGRTITERSQAALRRSAIERALLGASRAGDGAKRMDVLAGRYAAALRIGAVTVLTSMASIDASRVDELAGGSEFVDGDAIPVDNNALRACMASVLMRSSGAGSIWAHASTGEFLTAAWIDSRGRSIEEKIGWLQGRAGTLDALPGPVASAASWLASMNVDVAERLLAEAPALLLRSDRSVLDGPLRLRLVATLLERSRRGDRSLRERDLRSHFHGLWYAGIDADLARVILASQEISDTRDLALNLIDGERYATAINAALAIALDAKEDQRLRYSAARVVRDHGSASQRQALQSLAEGSPGDLDDNLKGTALRALWRRRRDDSALVPIEVILSWIAPPRETHYHGAYGGFLSDLAKTLKSVEIPIVLDRLDAIFGERQPWSELVIDEILSRAWEECGASEEVAAALVRLLARDVDETYARRAWQRRHNQEASRESERVLSMLRAAARTDAWHSAPVLDSLERLAVDEDIGRLLGELQGAEAGRAMWAAVAFHRFRWLVESARESIADNVRDEHTEHVERFAKARKANPELAEVSRWYFEEGVSIENDAARFNREHVRRESERSRRMDEDTRRLEKDRTVQYGRLSTDVVDAWWRLVRLIRMETDGWHLRERVDLTIERTRWWAEAPEDHRSTMVEAAARYVALGDPHTDEWFGQGRRDHRASAGYVAIELLASQRPAALDGLAAEHWARWTPVILDHLAGNEAERGVQRGLIQRAATAAHAKFIESVDGMVGEEIRAHRDVYILGKVGNAAADGIARRLLVRVREAPPPKAAAAMLEFISPHRPDDATEVAQSWLRGHAGEDEPRELARVGARHLLVRGERATWEPVWEVMEGDRAFGRAVFDDGTWFVERVQRRLREVETELLVRAWRWTVREWPYPVGNIEVGVVEEGRDLRDALLRELLRRAGIGRPDALTSLRQIAAEPTAPEGLPFGLARAEHEAKMRRWEPWTLADIRRTDPVPAQEALDDAGPKEG